MKRMPESALRTWMVYILRCADGSYYTGATNDLNKRLAAHHRGMASKYTRSRRPLSLLATSDAMAKSEALRLEITIKRLPKTKKIEGLRTRKIHPADTAECDLTGTCNSTGLIHSKRISR